MLLHNISLLLECLPPVWGQLPDAAGQEQDMEGGRGVRTSPRGALGPVDGGQEGQGSPNYLAEDFSIRVVRETVQVYTHTHTPVLISYLSCEIIFQAAKLFSSDYKKYTCSL